MSNHLVSTVYKRPGGKKWRKVAADRLAARDGAACAKCGAPDRIVWRNIGYGSGGDWVPNSFERARFTRVHPCSALEVDHKRPLSEGGTNEIDNLWLLCVDCHKKKTTAERSARLKRLFAAART